jgi:hypothetical protein
MATATHLFKPTACPICGRGEVEPIFHDLTITVRDPARPMETQVHALAAFLCINAHIFFVRLADLEHY